MPPPPTSTPPPPVPRLVLDLPARCGGEWHPVRLVLFGDRVVFVRARCHRLRYALASPSCDETADEVREVLANFDDRIYALDDAMDELYPREGEVNVWGPCAGAALEQAIRGAARAREERRHTNAPVDRGYSGYLGSDLLSERGAATSVRFHRRGFVFFFGALDAVLARGRWLVQKSGHIAVDRARFEAALQRVLPRPVARASQKDFRRVVEGVLRDLGPRRRAEFNADEVASLCALGDSIADLLHSHT